jgi:uncharacterized membrane protein YhaH (DUF805 family)
MTTSLLAAPAELEPLRVERMSPWQLFFSTRGRISRRTFWGYGCFALLGLALVGMALLNIAGVQAERAENLVNLLLAWPAIALSAKRWHDRNHSAWWVLVNLVPVVGTVWALVANGFLRGTSGSNRYGDDPLQARADRLI